MGGPDVSLELCSDGRPAVCPELCSDVRPAISPELCSDGASCLPRYRGPKQHSARNMWSLFHFRSIRVYTERNERRQSQPSLLPRRPEQLVVWEPSHAQRGSARTSSGSWGAVHPGSAAACKCQQAGGGWQAGSHPASVTSSLRPCLCSRTIPGPVSHTK